MSTDVVKRSSAGMVCQFPGVDRNEGVDAVEVPVLINDSEADVHANIAIELFSGPALHWPEAVCDRT